MRFFTFKQSALKLAVVSALALGGVTSALAASVGGTVTAINALTSQTDIANIADVALGLTDKEITRATLNNNFDRGWRVTVVSANVGNLRRTSGHTTANQVPYTNVKFVKVSGTLGAGLSDPDTRNQNITSGVNWGGIAGTTHFNTGTNHTTLGTASTATVNYIFKLEITTSANTAALSGTYADTITLTFADDAV